MLINTRVSTGLLIISAMGTLSCEPLAVHSTIAKSKELLLGVPCTPYHKSPVQITLAEINRTEKKCLFEVIDLESNTKHRGWVKLGEPIAFSPCFGTHEAILKSVKENNAIVEFWYFESKINLDLD